jgi:predicted HD phosphohydrolase
MPSSSMTILACAITALCVPLSHASADLRSQRAAVLAEVRALYADASSRYAGAGSKKLTELSHSLQAAASAEADGDSDAAVVAALLHDIGWKLSRRRSADGGAEPASIDKTVASEPPEDCIASELGIRSVIAHPEDGASRPAHEDMGAAWLRLRGFSEDCAQLVEGHVLAKRFQVAQDPKYVDGLSAASKVTLVYQGGAMNDDESRLFTADPLFDQLLTLRRRDEGAKLTDATHLPSLDHFLPAIERCIVRAPVLPAEQCRHFILDECRKLCSIND